MENVSEIWNELRAISPLLASIDKLNVFKTPDGYFEIIDKRITANVLLHESKTQQTQTVPHGYFDVLSNKILSKIKNAEEITEETKNISSLLFSLKDRNAFTVPNGYFENLNNIVLNKINKSESKVVSINSGKKWWRYMAAAVVVGIIMIGSLQLFNKKPANDNGNKFSTVSSNMPDYIKLSFQYKTPLQLENGIASLSDADIVNYLEQHGSVLDDDLITNSINAGELPDADDYLINDNTLNNFLERTNEKTQNE